MKCYAKTFFETYNFDSLTISPYMGKDSIDPFLSYPGKWSIILALTSNDGANDFQLANPAHNKSGSLYETVLEKSSEWGTTENTMFVVGATRPEIFTAVRAIVPDHFLLVPGIGAQGGDLNRIAKFGMNPKCGLIVNASRNIIYAGNGKDFAEKAREEALSIKNEMETLLEKFL